MAAPRASRGTPTGIDLTDELWTPAHLATYLHCGRSTAYSILNRPGFPTPLCVGHRRRLWVGHEVRAWLLATRRVRVGGPSDEDGAGARPLGTWRAR